jgi:hydroxyacylglutathione hydrolase
MLQIVTIETPGLGDRSYLAHDGEAAVVIDPQRDIDRVLAAAAGHGVRITHVLETHIHNDYVTGGLALSGAAGASYVVAAAEDVAFSRTGVGDGARFSAGGLTVTAVHTPGHTPGHLSYVLFWELEQRAGEVPGGEVWGALRQRLSCRHSRLDPRRAGRQVVHVDDDWSRAAGLGLPVTG